MSKVLINMIHQEVSCLFPEGHLDVGLCKKMDSSKHDISLLTSFLPS